MVSFWPDSIWTPEFTDLATVSPSPHRHLDAMAVAAAAAVLTKNVPIATSVVDTVRRHPSLLAQSALTIDHLSKGRFILGLGTGETENTVPYGFDFAKPVSRFEEALKVIRLLWDSDGPVDFEGQFYRLHHARLDTEPYEGKLPADLDRRRVARACSTSPAAMPTAGGRRAPGRPRTTPTSSPPCGPPPSGPGAIRWRSRRPHPGVPDRRDDAALAEILEAPLVKSFLLQVSAEMLRELRLSSTRWARTGAAIRTSTRRR